MTGRVTGLLVAALLVLAAGGCTSDGSASDPSASPGTTTGTTQEDAGVREKLAAGLADLSPVKASLVGAAETTVTPVEATWLHGWQVFDVYSRTQYHPQRFYAALSDDGTALLLSGKPDAFNQMVRNGAVVVDDASLATDVATFYLDTTRAFDVYSYRISAMSEVQWRPNLDATQAQQRAQLEAQYDALVQPPAAEPSGTGWTVTAWTVDGATLVDHSLAVAADGTVKDSPDVVATDLPVGVSP